MIGIALIVGKANDNYYKGCTEQNKDDFHDIDFNKQLKTFNNMNQNDINNMSNREFDSLLPSVKRSCHDCLYLNEALSLWCSNKEAIKQRGTSIPGCIKCPFWKHYT